MKAWLLKSLNAPGLILIALMMMVLQSTLFITPPLSYFQPDGVLLLVLWLAMKRRFFEGAVMALLLGYCMEINSATLRGLYLTHSMFIFLLTHFLSRNFHILNRRSLLLMGAGMALLSRLFVLFVLFMVNKSDNAWRYTLQLLIPSALVHAALIPIVFHWLHRFDLWTLKNPNAEHRHESDYYLDEEFI